MAKKSKAKSPLEGRWRITWMEQWDEEFINAKMQGYFEFGDDGMGSFHFGYVHGHIDYRITERGDQPAVEFSWEGNDEMDPALGRGWAVVNDKCLEGMLFFHQGDESEFKAERSGRKRR